MRDSCHTGITIASKTVAKGRIRRRKQLGSQVPQGFRHMSRASPVELCGCDETRKLTRFLRFGLTWSRLRPTVTVRNQLLKANTGRGADDHAI